MESLSELRIGLGYGATSYPYSKSDPHHGIDIPAPKGTEIDPSGVVIGLVGNTGYSFGNHCHIDKNKKLWVTSGYVNPSDWETITGEVIFAQDAGTAGLCVVIEADNGYFYRFLHMSKITCKVGDKIKKVGKTVKPTRGHIINMFREYARYTPAEHQIKYYMARDKRLLYRNLLKATDRSRSTKEKLINQLNSIISKLKGAK